MAMASNPVQFSGERQTIGTVLGDGTSQAQWETLRQRMQRLKRLLAPRIGPLNDGGLDPRKLYSLCKPPKRPAVQTESISHPLPTFLKCPPVPLESTHLEGENPLVFAPEGGFWTPKLSTGNIKSRYPERSMALNALSQVIVDDPDPSGLLERLTGLGCEWEVSSATEAGFYTKLAGYSKSASQFEAGCRKYLGITPERAAHQVLATKLPSSPTFPPWEGPQSLSDIEINKSSAAGPYYGRASKGEALEEILATVQLLEKAHSEGTWTTLLAEHPLLYTAQCKCKSDFYKTDMVGEKGRPYWSFNAHMSFLYSFLAQPFTKGMHVLGDTWNAYGFSWINGGAQELYQRAVTARELLGAIYGDDTEILVPSRRKTQGREAAGVLRFSVDISAMDTHVPHSVIRATVAHILGKYEDQHGRSEFMRQVARQWIFDATTPRFGVAGRTTLQTTTDCGLATGVTGTTLFDSVTSAICLWAFKEAYAAQGGDPQALLLRVFRDMGMTVKPGTEIPEFLSEDAHSPKARARRENAAATWPLGDSQRVLEAPFLGMQVSLVSSSQGPVYVPHLDDAGFYRTLFNSRNDPTSKTQALRAKFDKLRSLLLCGAAVDPIRWNTLALLIDEIPDEILAMRVHEGGGPRAPSGPGWLLQNLRSRVLARLLGNALTSLGAPDPSLPHSL